MRVLGLLLLILTSITAEDTLLLNTHIRMIPKIMALDSRIASKPTAHKIILAIIYDDNRKLLAQQVANSISQLYNGQIGSIRFTSVAVSVDELETRNDVSFLYMINMEPSSVKRVVLWSQSNSVPTFSYNPDTISMGVLGSIAIERNTVIYMNKNVMRSGRFRFNDSIFQIVRFIE